MLPQINWTKWFSNLPNNKDANRNMAAFSSILEAGLSEEEKASIFGGRIGYSYFSSQCKQQDNDPPQSQEL